MNELERLLEKLQKTSHETKKMITWIGVPVSMAVVIFLWLTLSDFGYKEPAVQNAAAEGVSTFEILKNGLGVTMKDIGDVVKGVKDKVNSSNSFNFDSPQNNASTTAQ